MRPRGLLDKPTPRLYCDGDGARYPSGKGEVCKTFIRKFDSEPRLQISPTAINTRSLAALGISPAGSRFAHARKPAQVRFSPAPPISPTAIRIVDLYSPSA